MLPIPTNLEYQAARADATLVEQKAKDEEGYKYLLLHPQDDAAKAPVFWQRKDYPDVIYRTAEAKLRAIATEILRYHVHGPPDAGGHHLGGTIGAPLRTACSAEPLRRLVQVLLLRDAWCEKNNIEEDGRLIPELQFSERTAWTSWISPTMRKLARDLDMSFNPEDAANLQQRCWPDLEPARRNLQSG